MKKLSSDILEYFGMPAFLLEPNEAGEPVYVGTNKLWLGGTSLQPEHAIGKTPLQVFPGRLGQILFGHHMSCLHSGVEQFYKLMVPINGKLRTARTTLCPVLDTYGRVIQIVGSSIDVTDQVEFGAGEAASLHQPHDLEQYISIAAHDLRTPMRHVSMIADMLREDFEDQGDGKLELINSLEDVAVKAADLIKDVLAHAEANQPKQPAEPFSILELCNDIHAVLDPMSLHSVSCEPIWVMAEKCAVQIVLRNLIDNAIKHSKRADVVLTISVTAIDQHGIEFLVSDNGTGFKDPAIAFLNSGELRVDSGFGLLGVRRMLLSRGGEIEVHNHADTEGCVIRFSLPGIIAPAQHNTPTLLAALQ